MFTFLEKLDILRFAKKGGTFLLNSIYGPEEVWDKLPVECQEAIIEKQRRSSEQQQRHPSYRRSS